MPSRRPETEADRRTDVRRAALEAVLEAGESSGFIDDVLATKRSGLDLRDRGLLQEIVYGAVRHQNTLDALLSFYLKLPVARQRPALCWTLRLAAYQIVYLRRIPAHAAVDQSLETLKRFGKVSRRELGFANAVLRRLTADITRKTDEPGPDAHDPAVLPARDGFTHFSRPVLPLHSLGAADHLAVKHSHPPWLVRRWLARYGEEEAEALLAAGNRVPRLTARVTAKAPSREVLLARLEGEGFTASAGPADGTVVFQGGGDLEASACLKEGWLQMQDLTAMTLGGMLRPPRGSRVLDLCAAPGGKAGQLLDAVGEAGHVVAADRGEAKLALLRENLERLGANFTLVDLPEDPQRVNVGERFSHVLVDVPCSNTGVLARRPDARWRLRPKDIESLATLQAQLLEAAVRHLAPGGRLVYSTCSLEPEENEERTAALLAAHPDLVELEAKFLLPHRSGADGGYGVLLRRAVGQ